MDRALEWGGNSGSLSWALQLCMTASITHGSRRQCPEGACRWLKRCFIHSSAHLRPIVSQRGATTARRETGVHLPAHALPVRTPRSAAAVGQVVSRQRQGDAESPEPLARLIAESPEPLALMTEELEASLRENVVLCLRPEKA